MVVQEPFDPATFADITARVAARAERHEDAEWLLAVVQQLQQALRARETTLGGLVWISGREVDRRTREVWVTPDQWPPHGSRLQYTREAAGGGAVVRVEAPEG